MRYAISTPNFGDWADPRTMVSLARDAETAGWDGFFLWDHIRFSATPVPVQDPWVLLSAIATSTERLVIGPMVTPLPRRRPWVVARQAVSIDHLSNGRMLLGVGLGEPRDVELGAFGEQTELKVLAARLDEGLAILDGLWSGEEFSFSGEHYQLAPMTFLPRPVQQPRIPIIVAGYWPNRGPIRRAARWDGMNALFPPGTEDWEEKSRALLAELRSLRSDPDAPFEYFDGGYTMDADEEADDPAVSADIGATWWIESVNPWRYGWDNTDAGWPSVDRARERIRMGPPRPA
jgi:alkanesulfonate monooxygenase SsuD/methylene tetrahydromethanopterin reductase-like flavin-dependent oxidoreductase (luciferase family)